MYVFQTVLNYFNFSHIFYEYLPERELHKVRKQIKPVLMFYYKFANVYYVCILNLEKKFVIMRFFKKNSHDSPYFVSLSRTN